MANTFADAVSQTIKISTYGGSWNWGSSVGNFYFANPFVAATPGTVIEVMKSPENGVQNLKSYILNVAGNHVSGSVQGIKSLSQGSRYGHGGVVIPLMWNTATSPENFSSPKK